MSPSIRTVAFLLAAVPACRTSDPIPLDQPATAEDSSQALDAALARLVDADGRIRPEAGELFPLAEEEELLRTFVTTLYGPDLERKPNAPLYLVGFSESATKTAFGSRLGVDVFTQPPAPASGQQGTGITISRDFAATLRDGVAVPVVDSVELIVRGSVIGGPHQAEYTANYVDGRWALNYRGGGYQTRQPGG